MNEPWVSGVEQSNLFYTAALGSFFFRAGMTLYSINSLGNRRAEDAK